MGTERSGSPEERIIRELYRTKEGGLAAGTNSREYGRVFETLLMRELRILAHQHGNTDIRFARGYVVEDYGSRKYEGASAANASGVNTAKSPRFDIVCYHGDVAWRAHEGIPHAMVPASFTYGVIEAKRTLSPGYFPVGSSRAMNQQFMRQRDYLDDLGVDAPLIVVGAHYRGTPRELRNGAEADHVAPLGDLSNKGSAEAMAQEGEIANVVDVMMSRTE